MLSFFAAMLPTEMSHNLVAINAYVIYRLHKSQSGVLSGWVGSLAAFGQSIALLRLMAICKANLSAKHALRDVMKSSDIPVDVIEGVGELSLRQWIGVLLPLPQPIALSLSFPGVGKTHTVAFAHVGRNRTTKLYMDVFKLQNACSNSPILLYVHGGGWVMGDRKNPPLPFIYQVIRSVAIACNDTS